MPKLDIDAIEQISRTGYPMPYAAEMGGRHYRRLGAAGGLTQLGVSHCVLDPGGVSSQRHWHEGIDEFVVILEGEAVLVEDQGETVMRPGDCAAFPKDVPNGHRLVNAPTLNGASPDINVLPFAAVGRIEVADTDTGCTMRVTLPRERSTPDAEM